MEASMLVRAAGEPTAQTGAVGQRVALGVGQIAEIVAGTLREK